MKRLLAIVILLLVVLPAVRADGPDDQYIQIYDLIQEGDSLSATQPSQAQAKYMEAQTALRQFQKVYPGWNDRVVNFRLTYLASKITIVSATASGVSNAPASPPPRSAVTAEVKTATPPTPVTPESSASQTVTLPVISSTSSNTQATVPPAPVVPALVTSKPEVQTPAAPATVLAPRTGPSAAELQNEIAQLQNQLRRVQNDKSLLEAKLREALAARPAGADPREFAQAQEKIRSMEKENALLQVSLAEEQQKVAALMNSGELEQASKALEDTKRQLAEQTARATRLEQENFALQTQVKALTASNTDLTALRVENATLKKNAAAKTILQPAGDLAPQLAQAQATIASLEADKEVWRLEKAALQHRVKELTDQSTNKTSESIVWTQDSEHVKQLERERDDLQKKLNAAQKELYGRNNKGTAARVDELANELETMRARLDVYEAKPVPYSAEELALFKQPEPKIADPRAGDKSVRELPAGTAQLVAEAQRDFASQRFAQAEQKYREVLRHDDKNVNTLANLATIQLELGHLDEAEKNLKAALAVAPDDSFSLSIMGNLKFRQGKYDEALDALSRAAKIDPQNAEVQNFLGLTLSQKGMRNAAETAFRKAILLNPNYAGAQNNLAVFYLTQQPPSVELARWHYEKAVAAGFPRNPDLEKMLDEKKTAQSTP